MHETVIISPKTDRVTVRDRHDTISIKTNVGGGGIPYGGPYEVVPNQSTQTLNTAGKTLANNVTVKPIPSNYGLITWNGSVLTVS